MKTFEDHWQNLLEEFDWQKVHNVMVALNWEWYSKDESYAVPSIGSIISTARKLCFNSYEMFVKTNDPTTISTGGFEAKYWEDGLMLKFVVEEWDTFD